MFEECSLVFYIKVLSTFRQHVHIWGLSEKTRQYPKFGGRLWGDFLSVASGFSWEMGTRNEWMGEGHHKPTFFSDRLSKIKLEAASKAQTEWLHEHETGALKTMAKDCSTGVSQTCTTPIGRAPTHRAV